MKPSKDFLDVFFQSRPALSTEEWEAVTAQLFLPDGSPDATIEAYSLQPRQASVGNGTSPPHQATNSHQAVRLDDLGHHGRPVVSISQAPVRNSGEFSLTSLQTTDALRTFAKQPDQSQVFFVRQRYSYSVLSVSASLYDTLASARCISPSFLGFLQNLGERDSEVEIVPPAPDFRLTRSATNGKKSISLISMFGTRFVELHGRSNRLVSSNPSAKWSMRQSAIYLHGGDQTENATCLLVTPSKSLQKRLESYLPNFSCLNTTRVIELQALILESSVRSWRPYIIALTMETDSHAANVLGATPDDSGPMGMSNAGERQSLMILDEKVHGALSALKHTEKLLSATLEEYEKLCLLEDEVVSDEIQAVFQTMLRESAILVLRLEALQTRLKGVASVVSNFLDLGSGFALQQLTLESRHENEAMRQLSERMHRLTEKATQDAAAVKVLTIMTMIYLPATVVSNFFSTSFVNTVGNDHIVILGDWWIFVATSVPLTLITLYIWLVWMRIQAYQLYPWWWPANKKSTSSKSQPSILDEESGCDTSRAKQA